MKVVIIGGVAGGASAAARLRRLDERAEIVVLERTGYMSYANCGLPYYIGGAIRDESELTLQTPESFYARFRVDVRLRQEATAINRAAKTVAVRPLDGGACYTECYDKLILAPGARPVMPRLPGVDSPRIYTLRTVEDTLRIRAQAVAAGSGSAVIVGGGFIGVELAENLRLLGLRVTIVEKQPQLLGQFDADMVSFLHAHMREKGVELLLGRAVARFAETDGGIVVHTDGGVLPPADMVVLAVGVAPESTLAAQAGLTLGARGAIVVDAHMQTSDPDIYAVGDAVEVTDRAAGGRTTVALAGPANRQGRVAADNICGLPSVYRGAAYSSVLKVFDRTAAATGVSEREARGRGVACEAVILSPLSHASYYPGAQVMTLKLVFETPSGRLLGAQIVGGEGVDKRIDVLATAIQAGLTAFELCDLDLAYAPPYSSAKDPVNLAGYMAENLLTGKVRQIRFDDLAALPRDGVTLLDTRTAAEYAAGHADGFDKHIPVDELRERLGELDRRKPVYVMCQSGLRSYIACRILTQNGFACRNFAGGYRLWRSIAREEAARSAAYPCGLEK